MKKAGRRGASCAGSLSPVSSNEGRQRGERNEEGHFPSFALGHEGHSPQQTLDTSVLISYCNVLYMRSFSILMLSTSIVCNNYYDTTGNNNFALIPNPRSDLKLEAFWLHPPKIANR